MTSAEIKPGTKIDQAGLLETSLSSLAIVTRAQVNDEAVEGQYIDRAFQQCPWCGHVGFYNIPADGSTVTIICSTCGQAFIAS